MMAGQPAPLAALIEFLAGCPARICAALLALPRAGDELVETLKIALPSLRFELVSDRIDPARLRDRADALASLDSVLVVALDGRRPFESDEQAFDFFRRLNFQREALAAGKLRTLLLLDRRNERQLATIARDLNDWVHHFDLRGFESANPRAAEHAPPAQEAPTTLPRWRADQVDVLRSQLERAKASAVPALDLAAGYAWPLFQALADAHRSEEARGVWETVLESGRMLPGDLARWAKAWLDSRGQTANATITWAHVSDFHFRGRADYGVDEVVKALLEDVAMFAARSAPVRGAVSLGLDAIFVTGDIAFSGGEDEYRKAPAFFERLSEATAVPRDRIFPIPGNHDGDRRKDPPSFMRSGIRGRAAFGEHWASPISRAAFQLKLAAYREFAAGLNPTLAAPGALNDVGGYAQTVVVGAKTLGVVGLGSSWLGQGGDEDRGRLITGKEQLYEVAGGVELPRLKGADLTVALMHHPLDWMQEFDQGELEPILADSAQLLLRGHLHRTGLGLHISPGHKLVTIAAGASYESSTYRNAYNVGRVTFTPTGRQLELWLRAYSPGERRFVKDVETYAAAEDGYWTWDLDAARGERQPAASAPVSVTTDVTAYLRRLEAENRWIELRGMGAQVAERLELTRVYTRLRVAAPLVDDLRRARHPRRNQVDLEKLAERIGAGEDRRDRELCEVLAEIRDVVLVGDPGAGKTTFLRFVALNLSRALLDDDRTASLARIGLTEVRPIPFPVFVRLAVFGKYLQTSGDPKLPADAAEHFYRYLDSFEESYPCGLPPRYLRERCLAGGCMLLLDGLDEVAGEELRERVGRIIEQVVSSGRLAGNRHVVTSRTRAYKSRVQLHAGFERCNLVDFGDDEVAEFVGQWSRALNRVPAPNEEPNPAVETKAEEYRQNLLGAIRGHESVGPLTANPLLLTVLAVLHWSRRQLPEQRAELYDAAIEYLLESRRDLSAYTTIQRRQCFEALALRMFLGDRGTQRTIGRGDAAAIVAPLLHTHAKPVSFADALAFLEAEEVTSGIVVSRQEGEVEFWHLTFQEYLAALGLSHAREHEKLLGAGANDGYWPVLRPFVFDDRWSEVVLLLGGCLRRLGPKTAGDLIQRILTLDTNLPGRARAVGLIGRILRDIKPYGGSPEEGTGYAEALDQALDLFKLGAKATPEPVRIEVGEALGVSGDPRLVDEKANEVWIAGGTFLMGAQSEAKTKPGYDPDAIDDREAPPHSVTVSGFWIDRYPVTVSQYQRFVAAGGYRLDRCWTTKGRDWRNTASRTEPDDWADQLRHSNRPVVNVTWFEASAYAAWAGKRLPTEAEWELAARGTKNRRYPWGDDEPTDQRASFGGRISGATPVGIYPAGATPEGVFDLAGNVWEWCDGGYTSYTHEVRQGSGNQRTARVVRGGSFGDDPRFLRAAFRDGGGPDYAGGGVGFRCVRSSPGGHSEA